MLKGLNYKRRWRRSREDANHIGNIDMKVLTGMVEDISREAQHNLVGALMEFIRSSKRL